MSRQKKPSTWDRYKSDVLPALRSRWRELYSSELTQHGKEWSGPCPLHGGDNPGAFGVNPDTLEWTCRTNCPREGDQEHAGGGPIEYLQRRDGLNNEEARDQLFEMMGIDLAEKPVKMQPLNQHTIAQAWASWCEGRHLDREQLSARWDVCLLAWQRRPAVSFLTPGGERVRFLDSGNKKTCWRTTGSAGWYGLAESLRFLEIGGTLYWVNGEPSMWACLQSNVPAVCTCVGEGVVPSRELIEQLVLAAKEVGARVAVVLDLDKVGKAGAPRMVSALRKAGMPDPDVAALALPADLGEKGDVDDLHRRTGDEGLAAALAELPLLEVNETEKNEWIGEDLVRRRNGDVLPIIDNVSQILEHDTECPWFWKNSFDLVTYHEKKEPLPVRDVDYSELRLYLRRRWACDVGEDTLQRWVEMVACRRAKNPLQEYLLGLKWDGEPRIEAWLRSAAGVGAKEEVRDPNDPRLQLWRAYSFRFLIQCVARALSPGCKADTMLVLVGNQGIKKSTLFQKLAGEQWFVDSSVDPAQKDTYLIIARAWVVEYFELAGLKRSDSEGIKSFLSRPADVFRPPYGRTTASVPRHTVFVGSTNDREFLKDPTGSRRFWPVEVWQKINLDWVLEHRDQLWAEAVVAYQMGEQWWLTDEEDALRESAAATFEEEDPWLAYVADECAGRTTTTIPKILGSMLEHKVINGMGRAESCRAARCLRSLGWTASDRREWVGRVQMRVWYGPLQVVEGGAQQAASGGGEQATITY